MKAMTFFIIYLLFALLLVISISGDEDTPLKSKCEWKISGCEGYYSLENSFFSDYSVSTQGIVTEITSSTKCKLEANDEIKIEYNYYKTNEFEETISNTPDIKQEDERTYFKPINKVILKKDKHKITMSFPHNIDTKIVPKLKIYGLCYDSGDEDGVVLYCGAYNTGGAWLKSSQCKVKCEGVYAGTFASGGKNTGKIEGDFGSGCTTNDWSEEEIG